MSERIITTKRNRTCEYCGGVIHAGTRCRRVHDDFMPIMSYYEHIRCPDTAAVPAVSRKTVSRKLPELMPL